MKKHHAWLLAIATALTLGVSVSTQQPVSATLKLAGTKLQIKNVDKTGKVTSKRSGHEDGQDDYIIKGKAKKHSKVYIIADKDGNDASYTSRITTVKANKKGKWKVDLNAIDKVNAEYFITQDKAANHKKSKIIDSNRITKKLKVLLPPNKGTEVEPFVASQFATNVTYDNLARTPDQFNGKKIVLEGQVMQTDDEFLLVWVNGNPDQILHVTYDSTAFNGGRILEDDLVQIYGKAKGTFEYETTNGDDKEVPTIDAAKIVDKGTAPDDYGY